MNKKVRGIQRLDESFIKELDDVRIKRMREELDLPSRPLSMREFTSIIPRHNFWRQIKEEMVKLPRDKFNKRGGIGNIFAISAIFMIILVVGFMVLLFSSLWNYSFNSLTTTLQGVESTNVTNISYYAGEVVFGNFSAGFSTLSWISYTLIFAMFLGVLIGMFVVRNHPGYLGLFVFGSVIFLMLSLFISRTYEDLYNDSGIIGTQLQNNYFTGSWMILHSPEIITGIAFIGAILMFVIWNRDPEQGLI